MTSRMGLQHGVVHLEGGWRKAHNRRGEGAVPVIGGTGGRAALRFHGTSASLWGSLRPRPGASSDARVSYKCTVNGSEWRTTAHIAQTDGPSCLCRSPALASGEHTIEFEVEEAVEAEALLGHFTLNEDSQSLAPRALVVVPVEIMEVVVVGPDISVIDGTTSTVGWKIVGTNYVTVTGSPSLVPETSDTTSSTAPPTTSTPPPPPPTTEPTAPETTTAPPPPPATVSTTQMLVPSTFQTASSPRLSTVSSVQTSQSSQTLGTSASFGFVTYTTSSSIQETTGLPGNTTAGSATAGESKDGLAPGAIVGIALGLLALVAASIIGGWILHLRRKRRPTLPMTPPSTTTFNVLPIVPGSPHTYSLDRKVGGFETPNGGHSSSNSISAGSQGISGAHGSAPLPQQQQYAPVIPYTPPSAGHTFLQLDPMARSDDGHSTVSPPTYYERPPTYHERQSTHSRPGYF